MPKRRRKMPQLSINRDKPDKWKRDISDSVDFYNSWFLEFAPKAFREARLHATDKVASVLKATEQLLRINPQILIDHPDFLPVLRMCTCPPIARDRLVGLSYSSKSLVDQMEKKNQVPKNSTTLKSELKKITDLVSNLIDTDIFSWVSKNREPDQQESIRAATIVADRLCGATADPIIRNAQEQRQLQFIENWLSAKGYKKLDSGELDQITSMPLGSFIFRYTVKAKLRNRTNVNIPIDVLIKPKRSEKSQIPLFIEAKSAGDFTNVNKRRKEEAQKIESLKRTFGEDVQFVLFLCGYFNTAYLGYEAAEGIDWVWEHRITDLQLAGV